MISRNYAYSLILDLDKDGVPELLEPVFELDFLNQIDCKFCNSNNSSLGQNYIESIFPEGFKSYSEVKGVYKKAENQFVKLIDEKYRPLNFFLIILDYF